MKEKFACKLLLFATLFVLATEAYSQLFKTQAAVYKNPVLNIDFPDPTVINVNDTFYAYATQAFHNGKIIDIQVATSTDKFNWKYIGDALPQKPLWANTTQDFWAPHVLYDSAMKKYVLFFCAKSNDTTVNMGIGVAFADKPAGPFIDKGSPLMTAKGFADIDPTAMIDPQTGKKILYWGSGFEPIKVQELSNDWSSFKEGTSAVAVVYPNKEIDYTKLIEGAWVDYYGGKYYLYYSGDNCCGDGANYAVMIARADNAFGPFTRLGEANGSGSSVIIKKDNIWLAPGHNSIFRDRDGNTFMAYHAIWHDKQKAGKSNGKNHYEKRVMCITQVEYIDGWPVILHPH